MSSSQLQFDAFESGLPLDRLFVGIFPDAQARMQIAAVAESIAPRLSGQVRSIAAERYHMTLHHLGDYPGLEPERIRAAQTALARSELPAFEATFDVVDSFRSSDKSPCILRCSVESPVLKACWKRAWARFAEAGFGQWLKSGFTPHVTLFYTDNALPGPIPVTPIDIAIRELVLVHSRLGQSRYDLLATQSLPDVLAGET